MRGVCSFTVKELQWFLVQENMGQTLFSLIQYIAVSTNVVPQKWVQKCAWLSFKVIQQQERRMHEYTCLCCFLPPRWNSLRFNQGNVKPPLPIIIFDLGPHAFSSFVRQPYSKQLYTQSRTHWSDNPCQSYLVPLFQNESQCKPLIWKSVCFPWK